MWGGIWRPKRLASDRERLREVKDEPERVTVTFGRFAGCGGELGVDGREPGEGVRVSGANRGPVSWGELRAAFRVQVTNRKAFLCVLAEKQLDICIRGKSRERCEFGIER